MNIVFYLNIGKTMPYEIPTCIYSCKLFIEICVMFCSKKKCTHQYVFFWFYNSKLIIAKLACLTSVYNFSRF